MLVIDSPFIPDSTDGFCGFWIGHKFIIILSIHSWCIGSSSRLHVQEYWIIFADFRIQIGGLIVRSIVRRVFVCAYICVIMNVCVCACSGSLHGWHVCVCFGLVWFGFLVHDICVHIHFGFLFWRPIIWTSFKVVIGFRFICIIWKRIRNSI